MSDEKRLGRIERDSICRMLDGCRNRICITDDPDEVKRLLVGAKRYLNALARDSLLRIAEGRTSE